MAGLLKFDPLNKTADIALSLGDTRAENTAGTNSYQTARGSRSIAAGDKRYWHIVKDGALGNENVNDPPFHLGTMMTGIASETKPIVVGGYPGSDALSFGVHSDGSRYQSGSGSSGFVANWVNYGSRITIAVDFDAVQAYVASGLVWTGDHDPQDGTGGYAYTVPGTIYPLVGIYDPGNKVAIDGLTRVPSLDALGWLPLGVDPATVTFSEGAITDNSGTAVTATDVNFDVFSVTGGYLTSGQTDITAGAATLAFSAPVVNGDLVRVVFNDWNGVAVGANFRYSSEAVGAVV